MTTLIIMNNAYNVNFENAQVTEAEAELIRPVYELASDEEFNKAEEAVANMKAADEIIEIATDIIDTLRYCGSVFMGEQDPEIGLPANWREASLLITEPGRYHGQRLSAEQLFNELNTGREFSRIQRREILARLLITIYKDNLNDFTDYALFEQGLIESSDDIEAFADGLYCDNDEEDLICITDEALLYFSVMFGLGLEPFDERVCAEAQSGIYGAAGSGYMINTVFDDIISDADAADLETA